MQCCDHLNKEKAVKGRWHQQQGREITKTNKLRFGSIHSVPESVVVVLVSFLMLLCIPHVVGFVALCAELTCRCTKLIHFMTCTRIPCKDSHCENGLVKCCLYTPHRLQQTAVSCKRYQRRQTTGPPVLSCRFARKLILWTFFELLHELHQESVHCHQLEEELHDWCRCWYFEYGTGLGSCSPDSWCRRFNVDGALLKSDRFLNGLPVFAE